MAAVATMAPIATALTQQPTFDVRKLGAVGDGLVDDTAAFERAFASASTSPVHAQVLVPCAGAPDRLGGRGAGPGQGAGPSSSDQVNCTYLIRPVNLTSSMELYIQGGATIIGAADHLKWPIIEPAPSYGQGRDHPGPRYTSLLHGEHLHDVTIRGDGASSVLDGQGSYWWTRHHTPNVEKYTRGHLIELMYSRNVEIAVTTAGIEPTTGRARPAVEPA